MADFEVIWSERKKCMSLYDVTEILITQTPFTAGPEDTF
jgi:hypothetical protein